MSNFKSFLQKESGLSTFSDSELTSEVNNRSKLSNPFPLDVFNPKVKPFINMLTKHYDLPRSFVGLALISSYSTAIGTSYTVSTNRRDSVYLAIWGALIGISSSGKSLVINKCFQSLNQIQNRFDKEWESKTKGLGVDKINAQKMDTVVYRDAHIPTLVKSVLPDNPKGVIKYSDELMEWINGLNQLSKKEGTDEQFWISSWNCTNYSGIRSGKQKFVVERPFVNVIGGTQYSQLSKMFAKDRDTTGFMFRLLFSLPEVNKIAEPDPSFEIPDEVQGVHNTCLDRLYSDLPVNRIEDTRKCILHPEAIKLFSHWSKTKTKSIHSIEDLSEQEIRSGIYGKIKEYALRFSAILHITDNALSDKYDSDFHTPFKKEEIICAETMNRALRLADYFYYSAIEVYERVQTTLTAPPEVLIAARLLSRGKTKAEIAYVVYGSKEKQFQMKVNRNIKKWIKLYPRVFNAIPR